MSSKKYLVFGFFTILFWLLIFQNKDIEDVKRFARISKSFFLILYGDSKSIEDIKEYIMSWFSDQFISNLEHTLGRRFILNDAAIKTTDILTIDKKNICNSEDNQTDDLILIVVISAIQNLNKRLVIRETWGRLAIEMGYKVLFLTAFNKSYNLQEKLEQEDDLNQDIIQGSFIDNYYNTTLKVITMIKWVQTNCNKARFVIKIDDDVYPNLNVISKYIVKHHNLSKSILGYPRKSLMPSRDITSKWFLPRLVYDKFYFPDFLSGGFLIITGDSFKSLFDHHLEVTPYFVDDVYLTGLLADQLNITRIYNEKALSFSKEDNNSYLSLHGCDEVDYLTRSMTSYIKFNDPHSKFKISINLEYS